MVKVKICGITNLDDALAAIDAGADMLGFNFFPPSSRFIQPEQARHVIDQIRDNDRISRVKCVGVFVDEPPDSLIEIVNHTAVDTVQLHGDEMPETCDELSRRLNGPEIIKALRVSNDFDVNDATRYAVDAIMLDAFHGSLRGGTGMTIDWEVARAARERVPRLFLSGGLSPENVAEAIARVRPYAVDACSSLESAPGRKDATRMKAFVCAAHQV